MTDPNSKIRIERWLKPDNYISTGNAPDTFTISYDIQWDSVSVYGRQDHIHTYKTTGQTVGFSFPIKPVTKKEKKALGSGLTVADITKRLAELTRPYYRDNTPKISPILKVSLIEGSSFYLGGPFLMAPTSVSIDYGDRLRNIQSQIYGSGGSVRGDVLDGQTIDGQTIKPAKMLITFSGAIIHQDVIYRNFDTKKVLRATELSTAAMNIRTAAGLAQQSGVSQSDIDAFNANADKLQAEANKILKENK